VFAPPAVEYWLRQLVRADGNPMAPSTKAKIRNLMSTLCQENPRRVSSHSLLAKQMLVLAETHAGQPERLSHQGGQSTQICKEFLSQDSCILTAAEERGEIWLCNLAVENRSASAQAGDLRGYRSGCNDRYALGFVFDPH
jgi:hypothetical protein